MWADTRGRHVCITATLGSRPLAYACRCTKTGSPPCVGEQGLANVREQRFLSEAHSEAHETTRWPPGSRILPTRLALLAPKASPSVCKRRPCSPGHGRDSHGKSPPMAHIGKLPKVAWQRTPRAAAVWQLRRMCPRGGEAADALCHKVRAISPRRTLNATLAQRSTAEFALGCTPL